MANKRRKLVLTPGYFTYQTPAKSQLRGNPSARATSLNRLVNPPEFLHFSVV
ncbi:MAG: hypothetical protein WA653_11330 [Candidatus Sulfotelmatobacter sp.]